MITDLLNYLILVYGMLKLKALNVRFLDQVTGSGIPDTSNYKLIK